MEQGSPVDLLCPSLVYGLAACGLTPKGLTVLETTCTMDLRRIARSASHITRESTERLRARLEPSPSLAPLPGS